MIVNVIVVVVIDQGGLHFELKASNSSLGVSAIAELEGFTRKRRIPGRGAVYKATGLPQYILDIIKHKYRL